MYMCIIILKIAILFKEIHMYSHNRIIAARPLILFNIFMASISESIITVATTRFSGLVAFPHIYI